MCQFIMAMKRYLMVQTQISFQVKERYQPGSYYFPGSRKDVKGINDQGQARKEKAQEMDHFVGPSKSKETV